MQLQIVTIFAITGCLLCKSCHAIHPPTTKTLQHVDSYQFASLKTRIITHTRRHHSHRSHTRAVRHDRITTGRSLFSTQFFYDLQTHLGLNINNSAILPPSVVVNEEKVKSQRSPRLRTTESPPADEVLAAGYPWNSQSHTSYRYRYKYSSYYYPPKNSQPEDPSVGVNIDPCILARWNYELPFSELPNMAAGLLASDMDSGDTTAAKARFMWELLHLSLDRYLHLDSSGDVFEIPPGFDLKECNFRKSEDPLLKSVNHLLNLYSSESTTTELLFALVKAAKACFGKEDQTFPVELLPCLDFSFGSEQVLKLNPRESIFGNRELCRKYLQHDMRNCTPRETHFCSEVHIETLRIFARHFYQCPEKEDMLEWESKRVANTSINRSVMIFDDDYQEKDFAYLLKEESTARSSCSRTDSKILPALSLLIILTVR